MGNKFVKSSFDICGNARNYSECVEKELSVEELIVKLCCYQRIGSTTEKKLVWLEFYNGKIPLIITPETKLLDLEKNVIPKANNKFVYNGTNVENFARIYKKQKECVVKTFLTQENFYRETKDNSILRYEFSPIIDCFCCWF